MNNNFREVSVPCNEYYKSYFQNLQNECYKELEFANNAKSIGYDVSTSVEIVPAIDLADRAETIIGLSGLAKRYRELFSEFGDRRKAYFQIFKEILDQKWCSIPDLSKRIELGIKACLLIETEGVVVAPLDGVPKVEVALNPDGSKYVDIYFAGPIRAAGGSSAVIPLILGDLARVHLGLDKYKPTKDEVERYVEEVSIYQNEIISRQNLLTDKEVRLIVENCPVCINGIPTEELEVSANRDLPRIKSNRIRGGVCLVLTEGVSLKALWVMDIAKKYGLDWSFLEQIVKVEKKQSTIEIKPNKKILDGLAAGRPVLAYPSTWGGFRLRYGRGRNTGIMAKGINPAGMILLDEFIAVGTHGKLERPGKATQFFPCDSIDGPIVLLKDKSVVKVNTIQKANQVKDLVEKILFIGDLLCTYGDFRKSAHPLVVPGYCEEWFALDIQKKFSEKKDFNQLLKEKGFSQEFCKKINNILENTSNVILSCSKNISIVKSFSEKESIALARFFDLPLNPVYLNYYKILSKEQLLLLRKKLIEAEKFYSVNNEFVELFGNKVVSKFVIKQDNDSNEVKKLLEKIGLVHSFNGSIIIEENALTIAETFGINFDLPVDLFDDSQLDFSCCDYLSKISGMLIKDKAGSFIGGRMGRPEQARPREMKGNPHVLFPIGLAGGSTRNILKAISEENNFSGKVSVEIAQFKCPKCGKLLFSHYCHDCSIRTKKLRYCVHCNVPVDGLRCYKCGNETKEAGLHEVDVRELFVKARDNIKINPEDTVKGIIGLISDSKEVEPLEKGLLRAKHDVHIFRDGTSRFELLNAVLTHFKPIEIGLSVEKAKKLGYLKDIYGNDLVDENQILELFPQDIIVNENCGEWMLRVSKFIDDLLERFYKVKRFYNAETKEDLIGALVLGLAPHTSAGVVARVIGYSKARVGFGHPYFICAKRRNVDGDQDSIMLLMDALLNFSNKYLSSKSGGRMDAPLVFTTIINPTEIDNEVHEMETCWSYDIDFYEKASLIVEPNSVDIEYVKKRLGNENQYYSLGYTHETTFFDEGPKTSKYVQLKSMGEKIQLQNALQKKISAVDSKDALERVMASHFLPDIIGNTRAFSKQAFRCTSCNTKYRRIPLIGKCYKCGKDSIVLTIHQGSIIKYLKIAQNLARQEGLSNYLIQRLDMVEKEINSIFGEAPDFEKEKEMLKQKNLFEFV